MGSKALPLLKGALSLPSKHQIFISRGLHTLPVSNIRIRKCSTASGIRASLQPPDVPRLAETARISLTPSEVCEAFTTSMFSSVSSIFFQEKSTSYFSDLCSFGCLFQVEEFAPKIRQVVDW